MATPTDGQQAHGILLGFAPLSRHGACWYYVWQAYAAAGASTGMSALPTAYKAWQASEGKHPGDMNPPPGAAIWLGRRYDGNMDGDVFIAGAYDGDHAATDQPVYGSTGRTSIRDRMNLCGREYLGWTDHVLDSPIRTANTPIPIPTPTLEEEMFIAIMAEGWFLVVPQGKDQPRAVVLDGGSGAPESTIPQLRFDSEGSRNMLFAAVKF